MKKIISVTFVLTLLAGVLNPALAVPVGNDVEFIPAARNLGVGVIDPAAKLEVNGQVMITGGSPQNGYVLTSNSVGLATWEPVTTAANVANADTANMADFATTAGTATNAGLADAAKSLVRPDGTTPVLTTNTSGNLVPSGTGPFSVLFRTNQLTDLVNGTNLGYAFVTGPQSAPLYTGGIHLGGAYGSAKVPVDGELSTNSSNIIISPNGTEVIRAVASSGNVGINEISPSEKLEVGGNVKADKFIGDGSMLTGITTTTVNNGDVNNTNVNNGDINNSNFTNGDINNSSFTNGDIAKTDIDNSTINNSTINNSTFNNGVINGATLVNVNISTANISKLVAPDGAPDPAVSVDNNGNTGIGSSSPNAKLDVDGEIIVGSTGLNCDSTTEGAIRYNSASKIMEYCNGSVWASFVTPTSSASSDPCDTHGSGAYLVGVPGNQGFGSNDGGVLGLPSYAEFSVWFGAANDLPPIPPSGTSYSPDQVSMNQLCRTVTDSDTAVAAGIVSRAWSSPGNNRLYKWNGSSWDNVNAASAGGRWLNGIDCVCP